MMYEAIRNILKSDEQCKDSMMNWFAAVFNVNKARTKLHYNPMEVGFSGVFLVLFYIDFDGWVSVKYKFSAH
jgi:hypothetical protein